MRSGKLGTLAFAALGLIAAVGVAAPAAAQAPAGATKSRWEVEVHGGGLLANVPTEGTAGTLPGRGPNFVSVTGLTTRRSSSWYFGDGAALMNEALAGFGVTPRITSLDPALGRAAAKRKSGGSAGVRASYAINARFSAEFSWDRASSATQFTDSLLDGIEASRASFIAAWNALIGTGGGVIFISPAVTSTAAINDNMGHRTFTTGSLIINFPGQGRLAPYVAIGVGAVSSAEQPGVILTGNYQMSSLSAISPGRFQVNETDRVTLSVESKTAVVTVVGAGVKTRGASRWGLRGDVRAHISRNTLALLLEAQPNVLIGTPAGAIASTLSPSIQFANNSSTGHASSLTGPAVAGLEVFKARGTEFNLSVTGGLFLRF